MQSAGALAALGPHPLGAWVVFAAEAGDEEQNVLVKTGENEWAAHVASFVEGVVVEREGEGLRAYSCADFWARMHALYGLQTTAHVVVAAVAAVAAVTLETEDSDWPPSPIPWEEEPWEEGDRAYCGEYAPRVYSCIG